MWAYCPVCVCVCVCVHARVCLCVCDWWGQLFWEVVQYWDRLMQAAAEKQAKTGFLGAYAHCQSLFTKSACFHNWLAQINSVSVWQQHAQHFSYPVAYLFRAESDQILADFLWLFLNYKTNPMIQHCFPIKLHLCLHCFDWEITSSRNYKLGIKVTCKVLLNNFKTTN